MIMLAQTLTQYSQKCCPTTLRNTVTHRNSRLDRCLFKAFGLLKLKSQLEDGLDKRAHQERESLIHHLHNSLTLSLKYSAVKMMQ